jgi:hypothetical protein
VDLAIIAEKAIVYGPLGMWAIWASWLVMSKDKSHGLTRDAHEAQLKAMHEVTAKMLQAQAEAHAKELAAIGEIHTSAFAEHMTATQNRHREEVKELTDRFVTLTTSYAEKTQRMLDKVADLADAMQRRR